MKKAILGKKLGMSQIFAADGTVIPVTVVEAGPCTVVQIKNIEKDGYEAVKVAYGEVKANNVNKPTLGQYKRSNLQNGIPSWSSWEQRLPSYIVQEWAY